MTIVRRQAHAVQALVLALVAWVAACASPIERARVALEEGEEDRAIEILEGIAREHPSEPGAWLALGRARMSASRPVAAREAFERAALLVPDRSAPRILVGHTYELERRYDEAELAYEQACRIEPSAARPERVLGARLLRWGRARDAIAHLERAVALDPDSATTWNALAIAQFHAGDGAAALDTLARAVADRDARGLPFDRDLAIGQAALLVRFARLDEALALYDRLVADDPRFVAAHIGRGLVLHELGRCADARSAFERAADVERGSLEARARLVRYLEGPGARCGGGRGR